MEMKALLPNSVPEPNSGCWLWLGALDQAGFAVILETNTRAHLTAWQEAHGKLPAGFEVVQSCGVNSCVNPEHLTLRRKAPLLQAVQG